jgi:hypothetical protein
MSWIEEACRWSIAYGYLNWHWRGKWRNPGGWKAYLNAYAQAIGLDFEEAL